MSRPRLRGLPVAVQIGLLLMASLIAAQVMSLALVVLTPPPPEPFYELTEVAAALKGGSLEVRFGPRLVRSVVDAPPAPPARPAAPGRNIHLLAALLGAPDSDVRLDEQSGPRLFHLALQRPPLAIFGPSQPPPPMPMMRGDGLHIQQTLIVTHGPPGAMRMAGGFIVGGFDAALRRPDGRWILVRSPHMPFMQAWHERMALWLFGCLLIVAPASFLFARRIVAPIHGFARAAQALGRAPGSPPMPVSGPAEIGAAAQAFNDMQARIRRYVEDRTAMVGAVSHDLRTPLARIRYRMERAPEELKVQVLSDVEQMERMIGSVLAFIRQAGEPGRRERLDLLSIVECVVDDAALPGGDIEIVKACPLQIDGDGLALQRMLTNLVDNALKYGRTARISLSRTDGEALIEIRDEGPGLPPAELARVFQPFYRANAARTLDDGGVGLGLSVARSIARAHGGDVELESPEGGGLLARVRLPIAPPP